MLIMKIDEELPGKYKVALSGRLDTDTVAEFDTQIASVLEKNPPILVFDMAGLEFISSAGISALFRVQKHVRSAGGQTLLLQLQPQVSKVLEIVRTVDLKSVFRNVAELEGYLAELQKKGFGTAA
jgi:anti-sigma B factor antagonist